MYYIYGRKIKIRCERYTARVKCKVTIQLYIFNIYYSVIIYIFK